MPGCAICLTVLAGALSLLSLLAGGHATTSTQPFGHPAVAHRDAVGADHRMTGQHGAGKRSRRRDCHFC